MKDINPFKLKNSKVVYQNTWIHVREDSVIRPGGKDGIFGIVNMQDGVTVVALDHEQNIFLTFEYAYATERYSLECISGGIGVGEDILDSAKREVQEEIGGVSSEWVSLGHIDPFTSVIRSINYLYLAKDVVLEHPQNTEEGEVIQVLRIPFNEAYSKVVSGEITHGASVTGILKTHILLNQ